MKAIVIGCGVIGLTTTLILQEQGWQVDIVTKALPGTSFHDDPLYVSDKAGAHWYSFAGPEEYRQQNWDKGTYEMLGQLVERDGERTGIMELMSYHVFKERPKEFQVPWFHDHVKNYRYLERDELPMNYDFGFCFSSFSIHMERYLDYLYDRVISNQSGRIFKMQLDSFQDISRIITSGDLVINCTGLGAKELAHDSSLVGIRGQLLIIRTPHHHQLWRESHEFVSTYIIPRVDGTVVLGGTFDVDEENPVYSREMELEILQRCHHLMPSISVSSEVLDRKVGIRPYRKGGVRLEISDQYVALKNGVSIPIVHHYGHGSFGVQCSWGSARSLVDLIRERFERNVVLNRT